jgi:hypothetical protein
LCHNDLLSGDYTVLGSSSVLPSPKMPSPTSRPAPNQLIWEVRRSSPPSNPVLEAKAASLHAIFGSPDDMKFRSCATLFAVAARERENPFQRALDRWCGGSKTSEHSLSFAALDNGLPTGSRMWRVAGQIGSQLGSGVNPSPGAPTGPRSRT